MKTANPTERSIIAAARHISRRSMVGLGAFAGSLSEAMDRPVAWGRYLPPTRKRFSLPDEVVLFYGFAYYSPIGWL